MKSNELNKLNVFIGSWHAEGTSYGEGQDVNNPEASGVRWVSDETYEWLPGNFFVLHKWDAKTGSSLFIGTEIIGYDETEKQFYSYFFDDSGNHPIYTGTVENNQWNFFEKDTKAKITINSDDTITFNWEWKHDGSDWLPLCNRIAKKIR
jgi:hypothetical protein